MLPASGAAGRGRAAGGRCRGSPASRASGPGSAAASACRDRCCRRSPSPGRLPIGRRTGTRSDQRGSSRRSTGLPARQASARRPGLPPGMTTRSAAAASECAALASAAISLCPAPSPPTDRRATSAGRDGSSQHGHAAGLAAGGRGQCPRLVDTQHVGLLGLAARAVPSPAACRSANGPSAPAAAGHGSLGRERGRELEDVAADRQALLGRGDDQVEDLERCRRPAELDEPACGCRPAP